MKLPGAERAVVDVAKLRDYCLNPLHPRGRHKARVFISALGLTAADAEFLRDRLLVGAREGDATKGDADARMANGTLLTWKSPVGTAALSCVARGSFAAASEFRG